MSLVVVDGDGSVMDTKKETGMALADETKWPFNTMVDVAGQ